LTKLLKKYPYEVSGGQKQRAAVARAMITEPDMILADEPYNTLDANRKNMLNKYIDMLDSTAFLIVSHQAFRIEREIPTEINF